MNIWRKWRNPRQKPPFGARIDWSDPITASLLYCWLVEKRLPYVVVDFGTEHANFFVDPANWETVDGIVGHTVSTTDVPRPVTAISLCLLPKLNYNTSVHFVDYGNVVTLKANNWRSPELLVNQSSIGVAYYAFNFEVGGFLCSTYDGSVWRVYRDGKKSAEIIKSASIGSPSGSIRFFSYGSISAARLYSFVYIFGRIICNDEVERLYYEPYSFFLIPAARIFDLAPSSGFTTAQDITWRLFTSKENQIIYNILTDKQASFGYKIFDRKDNSITYRIFTQDGSSFTWKIFTSSNQNISYKIFTRLQSDLSWAIASTALLQAISYKIFAKNEVNLSWLILTAEAASLDWSIFTTKEQQAIWNILAQTETDLLWDIYTRKDATLAYKVFKDLDQDLIYKIFNSTEQDLVWKILAAGLLSEILSWKIYAKQEDDLSWKVFAAEQQDLIYKIFNVKEDEITWLIKREDAADLSWKLFNLKEDPILWKIYSQAEKTIAWSILAALTSQDISYKIFTVKDEELFYDILAEASKSLDWKIYTFNEQDLSWQILTDTIPEPLALFKAKRRTLVFSPTRRIIVFKA